MPLATIKSSKSSAHDPLPVGGYPAKFDGIDENVSIAKPGKLEPDICWRWRFTVTEGAYAGREVSCLCDDDEPTPRNKKGRLLAALSGKVLTEGLIVNTDDFVGQRYYLSVQAYNERPRLENFTKMG